MFRRRADDSGPACGLHTHWLWESHADPDGHSYSHGYRYADRYCVAYSYCAAKVFADAQAAAYTAASPVARSESEKMIID